MAKSQEIGENLEVLEGVIDSMEILIRFIIALIALVIGYKILVLLFAMLAIPAEIAMLIILLLALLIIYRFFWPYLKV